MNHDLLAYMAWTNDRPGFVEDDNPEPVIRAHRRAMAARDVYEKFESIERALLSIFGMVMEADRKLAEGDGSVDEDTLRLSADMLYQHCRRLATDWHKAKAKDDWITGPSREFVEMLDVLQASQAPTEEWMKGKVIRRTLEKLESEIDIPEADAEDS